MISKEGCAELIEIILRITNGDVTYDPALAARLIELLMPYPTIVIESCPRFNGRTLKIACLSDAILFQYEWSDVKGKRVEKFALMYDRLQPGDGKQTALVYPREIWLGTRVRIEFSDLKRLWKLPEGGTKPDLLTPHIGLGIALFTIVSILWILFT